MYGEYFLCFFSCSLQKFTSEMFSLFGAVVAIVCQCHMLSFIDFQLVHSVCESSHLTSCCCTLMWQPYNLVVLNHFHKNKWNTGIFQHIHTSVWHTVDQHTQNTCKHTYTHSHTYKDQVSLCLCSPHAHTHKNTHGIVCVEGPVR